MISEHCRVEMFYGVAWVDSSFLSKLMGIGTIHTRFWSGAILEKIMV